ncbi:GNAT family N-acetyltransferase [Flavobacterium urumqiense]|uniref:Protein N-acetyltransferase, RimJ/RimL family n=1 Tax=Flavobacterium urumqiense TaxID=935224 RepID=A0A1H5Y232_9FLAO|nr:GNAT family N-acetyltransferase [Flavobacterium urumqiense]SEG17912.1 Protein N-acetyltransferase, RimJ/RimL family [Flavobacterium urumqiense]
MIDFNKEIFLKGDSISLRPLKIEDVTGRYGYWLNDAEITKYNSHGRFPMTQEKLVNFVKNSQNSSNNLVCAVITNETNEHIGNISLQSISWVDRNAEIAFMLGEKKYWGKGVMYEASKLLIDHAFKNLNLHRIHCGTSSDNTGMKKLAEKLGMINEGIRKEAIFNNGIYYDIVEYGILNKI